MVDDCVGFYVELKYPQVLYVSSRFPVVSLALTNEPAFVIEIFQGNTSSLVFPSQLGIVRKNTCLRLHNKKLPSIIAFIFLEWYQVLIFCSEYCVS